MRKHGWTVMRLRPWTFEAKGSSRSFPVEVQGPPESIGFLAVYGDHESAKAAADFYAGYTKIVEIEIQDIVITDEGEIHETYNG